MRGRRPEWFAAVWGPGLAAILLLREKRVAKKTASDCRSYEPFLSVYMAAAKNTHHASDGRAQPGQKVEVERGRCPDGGVSSKGPGFKRKRPGFGVLCRQRWRGLTTTCALRADYLRLPRASFSVGFPKMSVWGLIGKTYTHDASGIGNGSDSRVG